MQKVEKEGREGNTGSRQDAGTTHECTLPPNPSTALSVHSMLSTANVVRTAMLILLSPEPPVLHACTRQPSGTWMNAPLSAVPFRNMWIVLELVGLLLPLVEADEDEDNGSKVVQFHCGNVSCQPSRCIVETSLRL